MKRIKVLFTIPNFDTAGSGRALINIANGLDSNRFEVHIMCLHNKGAFFEVVENSGIPIHIYNYIPEPRPIFKMVRDCWRVSRYLKTISPDVIHSYHYSANYTEALASRMAGIPWVFTKKNMNWGGKSKNAWRLRSFLANKIAVQNKDMLALFYNGNAKAVLIPRGVDVSYFQPISIKKTEEILPIFPLNQRLLISVANFVPVKGIEILINAFYNLKDKHKDWSLLLVGDYNNEYGQQLRNQVADFEMTERIKFTGKIIDVRTQLNRAEVFVLPTKNEGRKEGSPVALLEAMAVGKVVLGSDIPGIRDQLESFSDYLFEPSNISNLSGKLDFYMSKTKADLEEIGNIFCSFVNSEYHLAKEVKNHAVLYESIINRQ